MTKRYRTMVCMEKVPEMAKKPHLNPFLKGSKRGLLPLLALFFSPIGIILLVILALLVFGLIGFGVFLTLNLFSIGGIILIITGLIAVVNGQINQFTIIIISLGVLLLVSPFIFNALGNLTLAAVLA